MPHSVLALYGSGRLGFFHLVCTWDFFCGLGLTFWPWRGLGGLTVAHSWLDLIVIIDVQRPSCQVVWVKLGACTGQSMCPLADTGSERHMVDTRESFYTMALRTEGATSSPQTRPGILRVMRGMSGPWKPGHILVVKAGAGFAMLSSSVTVESIRKCIREWELLMLCTMHGSICLCNDIYCVSDVSKCLLLTLSLTRGG